MSEQPRRPGPPHWDGPISFPSTSAPAPLLDAGFLLSRYLLLAESLIPHDWERLPRWLNHPIGKRLRMCRDLLSRQVRLSIPDDESLLPALGEIVLDAHALVHASGGDITNLSLGPAPGFGDADKARVFERHVEDADQYADVLVEMLVGAWHRDQGHIVRGVEEGRQADLKVLVPGSDRAMLVECKRIRAVSAARIQKELRAVNDRFRGSGDDLTVGVLHLSLPLKRSLDLASHPPQIRHAYGIIQDWFARSKLSRTNCVVLSWDDYLIAQSHDFNETAVIFRRRAHGLIGPNVPISSLRPYGGHVVNLPVAHFGP